MNHIQEILEELGRTSPLNREVAQRSRLLGRLGCPRGFGRGTSDVLGV